MTVLKAFLKTKDGKSRAEHGLIPGTRRTEGPRRQGQCTPDTSSSNCMILQPASLDMSNPLLRLPSELSDEPLNMVTAFTKQ